MKKTIYESPVGRLLITSDGNKITGINTIKNDCGFIGANSDGEYCKLTENCIKELDEYFAGKRINFEVPFEAEGTAFQRRVWKALTEIPFGHTKSYSQIAEEIGSPHAARAVGGACHNNPILIMIPCHRVIGKSGSLCGFGGGLDMKDKLLKAEKNHVS